MLLYLLMEWRELWFQLSSNWKQAMLLSEPTFSMVLEKKPLALNSNLNSTYFTLTHFDCNRNILLLLSFKKYATGLDLFTVLWLNQPREEGWEFSELLRLQLCEVLNTWEQGQILFCLASLFLEAILRCGNVHSDCYTVPFHTAMVCHLASAYIVQQKNSISKNNW